MFVLEPVVGQRDERTSFGFRKRNGPLFATEGRLGDILGKRGEKQERQKEKTKDEKIVDKEVKDQKQNKDNRGKRRFSRVLSKENKKGMQIRWKIDTELDMIEYFEKITLEKMLMSFFIITTHELV